MQQPDGKMKGVTTSKAMDDLLDRWSDKGSMARFTEELQKTDLGAAAKIKTLPLYRVGQAVSIEGLNGIKGVFRIRAINEDGLDLVGVQVGE